jgi:hypothetical protein
MLRRELVIVLLVLLYASVGHAQTVNRTPSIDKEVFTGDRARAFRDELARTNPAYREARKQSEQLFTELGYYPDDTVILFQVGTSIGTSLTPLPDNNPLTTVSGYMVATPFHQYAGPSYDDAFWFGNLFWYESNTRASQSINTRFDTTKLREQNPVNFEQPGQTTPAVPPATPKMFSGVSCDNYYQIPVTINQNTWNNSWKRIAGTAWWCAYSGTGWFGCMSIQSVSWLVVEGLSQLANYVIACR